MYGKRSESATIRTVFHLPSTRNVQADRGDLAGGIAVGQGAGSGGHFGSAGGVGQQRLELGQQRRGAEGLPAAASSATVLAPLRHRIRSAAAISSTMASR